MRTYREEVVKLGLGGLGSETGDVDGKARRHCGLIDSEDGETRMEELKRVDGVKMKDGRDDI